MENGINRERGITEEKNLVVKFYNQMRQSFFGIMFELLKTKQTSVFMGSTMILIMFVQLAGHLFDSDVFFWQDSLLLDFIHDLNNYCRLLEAIQDANSPFYYWALLLFGIIYMFVIICLLVYVNYSLTHKEYYLSNVVTLLGNMVLLLYWVFFIPFLETFLSIFMCIDGVHFIDTSLVCYQGIHFLYIAGCVFGIVILIALTLITATLYNETQPSEEDCLARLESFEISLLGFRAFIAVFTTYCYAGPALCNWVTVAFFFIASGGLCYQYYKYIPYYNSFISILSGTLFFLLFWISINTVIMNIATVDGQVVVIFGGIPLIWVLVRNIRKQRMETLQMITLDKLQTDFDALIQIQEVMLNAESDILATQSAKVAFIGIVNDHVLSCSNTDCPCKSEYELYDVRRNTFTELDRSGAHRDSVFLTYFTKRMYEDALVKFVASPGIHIAYSYYLFKIMRNIHASLIELNIAQNKKPSLQQMFTIFRYKSYIEDYIKQDHQEHSEIYPQLINVTEFERLFAELSKSIETVCNYQIEFWTHLSTLMPDLNVLNDLGKKIYNQADKTDAIWLTLCKINPQYPPALSVYGEYQKDIRNHENLGRTFIEKSLSYMGQKKSIDENMRSTDTLFSDDTSIIHISGNKDSVGKIIRTSQGLSRVFGYSKSEVVGHSVNILMPAIFAVKHNEMLSRFFKTGRQIIFYQERMLFATHRNGHCFQMKILVKQMPTLVEGIQYVGMIKPVQSDVEFILTDMNGLIDSFSKGVSGYLGLSPNLFKDKESQINIQLIAPELINFFVDTQKRQGKAAKSKYRDVGGEVLQLIVPKDFNLIAKSEGKKHTGAKNKGARGGHSLSTTKHRSPIFRNLLRCLQKPDKIPLDKMPTAEKVLQAIEYVQYERKREAICELTCIDIKCSAVESLKMMVLKLNFTQKKEKLAGSIAGGTIGVGKFDAKQVLSQENSGTGFEYLKQDTASEKLSDFEDQSREEVKVVESFKAQTETPSGTTQQTMPPLSFALYQGKDGVSHAHPQIFTASGLRQDMAVQESIKEESLASEAKGSEEIQVQVLQPDRRTKVRYSVLKDSKEQDISNDERVNEKGSNTSLKALQARQNNQTTLKTEIEQYESEDPVSTQKEQEQDASAQQEDQDSEIETPRVNISNIQMRVSSAQKEKQSFLNELKGQLVAMSEDSTKKIDVKTSINIGGGSNQKSSTVQQSSGPLTSGGLMLVQQNAGSMVKKTNLNSLQGKEPTGDTDKGEDEEVVEFNQENGSSNSPSSKKSQPSGGLQLLGVLKKKDIHISDSNQAGMTDEEFEDDEDLDQKKKKQDHRGSNGQLAALVDKVNMTKRQATKYRKLDVDFTEDDDESRMEFEDGGEENYSARGSRGGRMEVAGLQPSKFKKAGVRQPQISSGQQSKQTEEGVQPFDDNYTVSKQNSAASKGTGKQSGVVAMRSENIAIKQSSIKASLLAAHIGDTESTNNKNQPPSHSNSNKRSDKHKKPEKAYHKMDIRKKDTSKLKTNPKYRCVDVESDDGAEEVHHKAEDDHDLESKEAVFRETLIKVERKRLRREKKQRDRDAKRAKQANSDQLEHAESGVSGTKKDDSDSEGEESSESSISSLESEDDEPATPGQKKKGKSKGDKKGGVMQTASSSKANEGMDTASSASQTQNRTERNHFTLRLAIEERYVPQSIRNTRYVAIAIFVLLIVLAIIFFVIQSSLYTSISEDIHNISYSEDRNTELIEIALRTRTLVLVSQGYYPAMRANDSQALVNLTLQQLRDSASGLMLAQTNLTMNTQGLDQTDQYAINSQNVTLIYKQYPNMATSYSYPIWEAVMEMVVNAYRVSTGPVKSFVDSTASVYLLMNNCVNSAFESVSTSSSSIISQISNTQSSNMSTFLYILIGASCSMLVALMVLIPIINKVRKNKQEVLELFTHKAIEKHIDDQLKICRDFIVMRLQQNGGDIGGQGEENDLDIDQVKKTMGGDAGAEEALEGNRMLMKRKKKGSKGKKWKPLNSNFGETLVKFFLFLCIIEGYFFVIYFLAQSFLNQAVALSSELQLLVSRQTTHDLLLFSQIEMLYSNGTSSVNGNLTETYVTQSQIDLFSDEENLLNIFASNFNFHTTTYNNLFNTLYYTDMCAGLPLFANDPVGFSVCEVFSQGILKKGLYSSVIKYWDYMRQLTHDFKESQRQKSDTITFLSDQRLQYSQAMQDTYLAPVIDALSLQLESDIDSFFTLQYVQNRAIFIVYIVYLAVLYMVVWRRFVRNLKDELWKTKSMLTVLPTKLCFDIEEIRYFIYAHSSNDFISTKA